MGIRAIVGLCVSLVAAAGCDNGSPAAPSPPPPVNIAGLWQGTTESSWGVGAIRAEFTQAGDSVNGTWVGEGSQGTIVGTATHTNFSGTMTISTPAQGGGICNGSGTVSGPLGAGQNIRWTSPGFGQTDCTGMPTNIVVLLQRR